jgi:hypothetical protein
VRGNLDIGVQGKPVDTGTAGTAQERSLPLTMSWSDDTTGTILSPVALVETLAALVPLPWCPFVRPGGCGARPSSLRSVPTPIPRQQSAEGDEATIESSHWSQGQLLKHVLALARAT